MPLGANRITLLAFQATVAAEAEVIRKKTGIQALGNAQIDTAQSKFGGSSLLLDGSGDKLQIEYDDRFVLDYDNWTIEYWIRLDAITDGATQALGIWSDTTGDGAVFYVGPNAYLGTSKPGIQYLYTTNGSNRINSNSIVMGDNTTTTGSWQHHAFVKNGNTLYFYENGTQSSITHDMTGRTMVPWTTNYQPLWIGGSNSSGYVDGYMDEIRISNSARYTSGFTPSTTAFVNDDDTLLLIHCDGTDASTYFDDDNGVGRSAVGVSAIGNAQIDTARYKFGGSSALFDGTGDYLKHEGGTNGSFYQISGSWTVECWFNPVTDTGDNTVGLVIVGSHPSTPNTGGGILYRNFDNKLQCSWYAYNGSDPVQQFFFFGGSTITNNTWNHLAMVYDADASTWSVYLNGTSETNQSVTYSGVKLGNNGLVTIGGIGASLPLTGNIDEVRISNTARYTANFTAPTAPFVNDSNTLLLLHMDGTDASTLFLDDNGAIPSSTEGTAVEFDGTNDYYQATSISTSASDNQYLLFACTFYRGSSTNLQHLFNLRLGTGSSDYGFWVWINGGRTQVKMVGGTGSNPTSIYENTENSFTLNDWNQVVVWWNTSDYANSKIFVNGEQKAFSNEGTTSVNWNWGNTATTLKIGELNSSQTGSGADFNGKVSQLYISNPSSFPGIEKFYNTGPLDLGTTGTNTGLASPLIYHYGDTTTFTSNNGTGFASYTLTANGNVTSATADLPQLYNVRQKKGIKAIGNGHTETSQSKFGGASYEATDQGNYLDLDNFGALGNGDWTLEAFVQFKVLTGAQMVFDWRPTSQQGAYPTLYVSGNNLMFYQSSGTRISSGSVLSTNTWYHFALCKSGNSTKLFIDGTQVGSTYTDNNTYLGARLRLFGDGFVAGNATLDGFVDELRISKSARYTENFTPTTESFQNDANTLLLLHMDGTDGATDFVDDNGVTTAGQP